MAVYKATYCYPNLSAVDIRTAMRGEADEPVKYLKCKVDTSNKDVTGYSVRLLDGDNNVVFEPAFVSPVSELKALAKHDLYEVSGTNSGMNGTYLQIPFFQNADLGKGDGNVLSSMLLASYNAVYYKPRVSCDYVVFLSAGDGADNRGNWSKSGDTLVCELPIDGAAMLNGEPLKIGDTVLFAGDDLDASGFWKVSSASAEGVVMTPLIGLANEKDNKLGKEVCVTILKGRWSSSVFVPAQKISSEDWELLRKEEADYPWWQRYDSDGKLVDVEGLKGVSGDVMKWEITLYQGKQYLLKGDTAPVAIDYFDDVNTVEDGAYDMALTSGTVLGSTASRIQISDLGETVLPKGLQGTLVLQTRYIDVSNVFDGIHNGTRVYVETYDSTYGHVYPIEGDLSSFAVSSSSCAQFFKHSNNPEDILAGDKVDYATTENLAFTYRKIGSDAPIGAEEEWMDPDKVSCTERLLCIDPIDGLSSGDTILLMGQSRAYQNGIWQIYSAEAVSKGTTYTCLRRGTSYGSWSAYIGKVIYSPRNAVGNYESLAGAGAHTLWNPHETASGDDPLLFTSELPILLFPQLLGSNGSVAYYCDKTPMDGGSIYDISEATIDGVTPAVGDFVLCNDYSVYRVTKVEASSIVFEKTGDSLSGGDLFYVSGGGAYGHRAWRVPSSKTGAPEADWSLFTAKILKNTATRTYISPFTGLKKGMRLKLQNGKQAVFDGGSKSAWIPILGADQTFYSIDHKALERGSEGTETKIVYDGISGSVAGDAYGLVSDESPDASSGTPWKYEIRTFFKASDENVIYLYSDPYLIGYKDGEPLTDARLDVYITRFSLPDEGDLVDADERYYLVRTADGSAFGIAARSVTLRLDYVQREGVSWESCRWTLLDAGGNLLQDTGKMYGGDMSVTFYGLANDTKENVVYYAVAYVDDEKGNSLRYVIEMPVVPAEPATLQAPFEATFDCKTDSVVLSYSDTLAVPPTYKVTDSVVQTYDSSSSSPQSSLWDGGISYGIMDDVTGWVDNYASILDEGKSSGPLIDSPYGSSTGMGDAVVYSTLTSRGTADGVSYSHAVAKGYGSAELSQNTALKLKDSSSTGGGEFYFEAEVALDDDFGGDILAVDVESDEGAGETDPGLAAGSAEVSRKGYLTIGIRLPEQISEKGYVRYDKRNLICAFVEKDGDSGSRKTVEEGTEAFSLSGLTSYRYYLQYEDASGLSGTEFVRQSLDGKFLWKRFDPSTGKWYAPRDVIPGNLNLISTSDDAEIAEGSLFQNSKHSGIYLSHWAEDMYHTDAVRLSPDIGYTLDGAFDVIANLKEAYYANGLLKWPSDGEDEQSKYWNEASSPIPSMTDYGNKDTPVFWDDVGAVGTAMAYLRAHKRYENAGLSKRTIRVAIRVTDVKGLYDGFDSLDKISCEDGETKLGGYGTVTVTVA